MTTLLVAIGSFVGFLVAYHTYGRWLARKIFALDGQALVPSRELRDNVDFVPTRPFYLFGQHFSAIAAAGPIVGPILACQQFGWLPALMWITVGVIFAAHGSQKLFGAFGGPGIEKLVDMMGQEGLPPVVTWLDARSLPSEVSSCLRMTS